MSARYSRTNGYTIAKRTARPPVRTVQRRIKFGPTTAKFFGLTVLAILAAIMLSQASTNNLAAYQQNDLRKQASQVDADIERLRVDADRVRSIQSIQQAQVKKDMVPIGNPDHIQAGDEQGQVAGVSTQKP